jgi:hypothetical protein
VGIRQSRRALAALGGAALVLAGTALGIAPGPATSFASAQSPAKVGAQAGSPTAIAVPSLRDRARVIDRILKHRLETLIPRMMREEGVEMWILMSREYFEDPVTASMLDARSLSARRRTILVFYDPGEGQPIERLTVSRYGLAGLFEPAWDPAEQPGQWKAVADIIAARDPENIAINVSKATRFADGMTHSQYLEFAEALAPEYVERIISGETLSTRWLETRTGLEMELYPRIVALAHEIIGEALSTRVITPGETTCADVQWWYREKLRELGVAPWFHPSIAVQREGAQGFLDGKTVIEPGDLVWTDFGLTLMRLNTDTQHLAYVLKPGESEAPAGLREGLANSNRVQDILTANFQVGLSGNEVLARARKQAVAEGLDPSIYTHPIGLHGHGAGPSIGFWDNQEADPRGTDLIRPDTAWSIELTSYASLPEWGGQRVDFRTEEDAFFDGASVTYIDGRQTEITLIGSG